MTKRKFKEELLQAVAPEIYGPADYITKREIKHVKKLDQKKRKKWPQR
ncbi:V core protein [Human mastadenovirus A]|nr:V core protein [Human mastadenovirus A]UXO93256.1 V core protein [Human mastadenovirus A]